MVARANCRSGSYLVRLFVSLRFQQMTKNFCQHEDSESVKEWIFIIIYRSGKYNQLNIVDNQIFFCEKIGIFSKKKFFLQIVDFQFIFAFLKVYKFRRAKQEFISIYR
eukprot:TRINITY_DN456_c0_g1_i11.p16 TRINITY_DN456_c0_g1~~TRINITY_DN456_c0_g1_i11.p16  ORF type:complete len:108 (-),score=2.25 TRINITY_DN456_c0_g1_i11:221-544(-)